MKLLRIHFAVFAAICFILCNSNLKAKSITGDFKAIYCEKINDNYYVVGVKGKSVIQIDRYNEKLELVKQFSRPLPEDLGSLFGTPYLAVFTSRKQLDLRIVYESGILAWLCVDLNLNELGISEYDHHQKTTEPGIYNPVYSQGSYFSNFGVQKTLPAFYVKNNLFHFMADNTGEFTNTSTGKLSYYRGAPVLRKLTNDGKSPFYKEVSRTSLSENEFLTDFNIKKFLITYAGNEKNRICFLANKKTRSIIKDDIRLIKVDENTLTIEKTIDLNLDSLIPELGSTFFATTVMDEARQRIIQIGNYTASAYDRKWWHNELDNFKREYLKIKGFYICEFDMDGVIKKIKTFPLPDNGFPANDEQYRALRCQTNGIVFSEDGTINIVAENCVLATTVIKSKNSSHTKYSDYAPVGAVFLSVDQSLEKLQSESVPLENTEKGVMSINNTLIEYNPQVFVNYSTALLTPKIVADQKVYFIYSAYRGMSLVKVVPNESVMLYDKDSCVIFKPANDNGVYELSIETNH